MMEKKIEEVARCRGCGRVLKGKPYYMGGQAYHPVTNEPAKANHYGGWVCSEACDYRASLELEQSMPGHDGQKSLSGSILMSVKRNWHKP